MSHHKKGHKGGKTSKAEKREFDEVLNRLNKESREVHESSVQKGTFAVYATVVAAAPIYLYAVGVYETNILSNLLFFVGGALITAATLFYFYGHIATHKIKSLLEKDGTLSFTIGESQDVRRALLKAIARQSTHFSLFLVNFIHLIFYLTAIGYILPSYQLSHPTNYLASTVLSAGLTSLVLSVVAKIL